MHNGNSKTDRPSNWVSAIKRCRSIWSSAKIGKAKARGGLELGIEVEIGWISGRKGGKQGQNKSNTQKSARKTQKKSDIPKNPQNWSLQNSECEMSGILDVTLPSHRGWYASGGGSTINIRHNQSDLRFHYQKKCLQVCKNIFPTLSAVRSRPSPMAASSAPSR